MLLLLHLWHIEIFLTDLLPAPTAHATVAAGHEVAPEPAIATSLEVESSPLPSDQQRLNPVE